MTDDDRTSADDFDRYARQMRYPPIGEEGQRRLSPAAGLGLRLRRAWDR